MLEGAIKPLSIPRSAESVLGLVLDMLSDLDRQKDVVPLYFRRQNERVNPN